MTLSLPRIISHFVLPGVAIGLAFTALPADAAALVVVNNADSGAGSLRAAISASSAGDTIQFDETQVVSPIVLTSGELLIDHNLTITGPTTTALTISGSNASRVFDIKSGTVNISSLTISNGLDNSSGSIDGAGIVNSGALTLSNSTISNNHAVYFGGGIANYGTLSVANCTVFGNSADSDNGGGISNSGTLTLSNSTISGNTAGYGGGGISNENGSGTFTVTNSIIAGNFNPLYGNPDVRGAFISGGYNLIGQIDGGDGFTASGDQIGTIAIPLDPLFDTAGLTYNGGPTQTIALQATSPAINTGDPAFVGPPAFDQRGNGFPRVQSGRLDIGAFEAQAGSAPIINSFAATSGPSGASVTIRGHNLTGATTVKFGGQPAATGSVAVNANGTAITVPVAAAARSGAISGTTPTGTASKATFTVTSPTILGFSPVTGKVGSTVKLTGVNFTSATGVSFAKVGGGWTSAGFGYNAADKSITLAVPDSTLTGKIRVADSSGSGLSSTPFTQQSEI